MELPTVTSSAYASSVLDPRLFVGQGIAQAGLGHAGGLMQQFVAERANIAAPAAQPKEQPMSARIVKVFIADSNENLPLEKRVIYSGEEKLTDLTDQELFFEVPIADLLAKHNEVRAATVDKKQAEKFGRDIFLEPARIRDLKMVVVNVAAF